MSLRNSISILRAEPRAFWALVIPRRVRLPRRVCMKLKAHVFVTIEPQPIPPPGQWNRKKCRCVHCDHERWLSAIL